MRFPRPMAMTLGGARGLVGKSARYNTGTHLKLYASKVRGEQHEPRKASRAKLKATVPQTNTGGRA